jgi:hypothetical protein
MAWHPDDRNGLRAPEGPQLIEDTILGTVAMFHVNEYPMKA